MSGHVMDEDEIWELREEQDREHGGYDEDDDDYDEDEDEDEPESVPTPTIEYHLSGDATPFDTEMGRHIAALDAVANQLAED